MASPEKQHTINSADETVIRDNQPLAEQSVTPLRETTHEGGNMTDKPTSPATVTTPVDYNQDRRGVYTHWQPNLPPLKVPNPTRALWFWGLLWYPILALLLYVGTGGAIGFNPLFIKRASQFPQYATLNLALTIGATALAAFFILMGITRRRLKKPDPRGYYLMTLFNCHEFGIPGDTIGSAADRFGASNVSSGVRGEELTGELISPLAQTNTWVFHGLPWPGSPNSDVDHAVARYNRVVLIDSKMWTAGTYEVDNDGMSLLRDGKEFRGSDIKMGAARQAWQNYLPSASVFAVVVLHNEGKGIGIGPYDYLQLADGTIVCTSESLRYVLGLLFEYRDELFDYVEPPWDVLEMLLRMWEWKNMSVARADETGRIGARMRYIRTWPPANEPVPAPNPEPVIPAADLLSSAASDLDKA